MINNSIDNFRISQLPLYWRLTPSSTSPEIVKKYLPFEFGIDIDCGLIIQKRSQELLSSLEVIYQQEYNIGYLQDTNNIARPYGEDFVNFLYKAINENKSINNILEIGCGGCVILEILQNSGFTVTGIDSSPFAKSEGIKRNIQVHTDFFPSPLLKEKFDLIYHVDVLEHIDDYINFLKHQYDHLKPNGLIVVNVPDASSSIELGDISIAMHQHLNYFTPSSLKFVLEKSGFKVESICKSGYGSSLYAIGRRVVNNAFSITDLQTHSNNLDFYIKKSQKSLQLFRESINSALADKRRSLGFYVPLRAIPYLSCIEKFNGFRFFDDTNSWHLKFFDGINVPIENFEDLEKNPVTDLYVMSLTFGDVIKEKILRKLHSSINVVTLSELIQI
jgi:SAM-dependent methyltransferase